MMQLDKETFLMEVLKKLLHQDSKYSNKSTIAMSIVSAYSFGDPSLRLTGGQIENRLYITFCFDPTKSTF